MSLRLHPNLPRSRADWIGRAFWLGLMALHAAPLGAVLRRLGGHADLATAAEAAFLAAALAYFATKVLGIRYVQLRCRWTAVLVFAVVCGLAHGEVRRGLTSDMVQPAVVVATGAAAAAVAVRARRVLVKGWGLGEGGGEWIAALLRARSWRLLEGPSVSAQLRCAWLPSAAPRGPPAF